MSFDMDHEQFASFYGPTTGDSVRLGDTDLFAKVERPNSSRTRKFIRWWKSSS